MQPVRTIQKFSLSSLLVFFSFTLLFQPFKSHLGLCFSLQQKTPGKHCVEIWVQLVDVIKEYCCNNKWWHPASLKKFLPTGILVKKSPGWMIVFMITNCDWSPHQYIYQYSFPSRERFPLRSFICCWTRGHVFSILTLIRLVLIRVLFSVYWCYSWIISF